MDGRANEWMDGCAVCQQKSVKWKKVIFYLGLINLAIKQFSVVVFSMKAIEELLSDDHQCHF